MGEALSEVLPFAVGVAIVPIPVVAVILVLFSDRARVNGRPMFLLGWVGGLAFAFGLVVLLAEAGDVDTDESAADSVSWATIVFGLVLLGLAARSWRKRPAAGAEPALPSWMSRVDSMSPPTASVSVLHSQRPIPGTSS